MTSMSDVWYLDLDGDGNIRWYNMDTDEAGSIWQSREDV